MWFFLDLKLLHIDEFEQGKIMDFYFVQVIKIIVILLILHKEINNFTP